MKRQIKLRKRGRVLISYTEVKGMAGEPMVILEFIQKDKRPYNNGGWRLISPDFVIKSISKKNIRKKVQNLYNEAYDFNFSNAINWVI